MPPVLLLYSAVYRPDIDGLRAISILSVIWYHALPESVGGGFIGVDIFFVISGFLITGIISDQIATGSFSVVEFYRRRVRRIFPALVLVLLATYVAGWMVLLPREFQRLGESIVAGAGFFSNFLQWGTQDYFASDATLNPLLHLWSLGIEEQFYILWPLIVFFLPTRNRMGTFVTLALISMAANLFLITDHQAVAFYSPFTRGWELLTGAILAHVQRQDRPMLNLLSEDLKSISGLLLIGIAVAFLDRTVPYPGWLALLPVGGAALLLDSAGSFVNRRILSHRVLIYVGLISYPLYLWHWPILSYLSVLRGGVPNFIEKDIAVALAFILASGTYHFVELPIRKLRYVTTGLALSMIATAVAGLVTIEGSGLSFRFPPEIREIAELKKENSGFREYCFVESGRLPPEAKERCVDGGSDPLVLVWGDSTAASLYPGLRNEQQRRKFRIAQFTTAGCAPLIGADSNSECAVTNHETLTNIGRIKPEIVVLHAMWDERSDLEALARTVVRLREMGVARIVALGPVPVWKRSLPFMLVNAYRLKHEIPYRIAEGVSGPAADDRMAAFITARGIEYISARKVFCSAEGCITRVGPRADDVVIWDQVHLSAQGSNLLVRAIARALFDSDP